MSLEEYRRRRVSKEIFHYGGDRATNDFSQLFYLLKYFRRVERISKAEQRMDALCLPAENVYCRRVLRSILFLVFNSALRNPHSAIGMC